MSKRAEVEYRRGKEETKVEVRRHFIISSFFYYIQHTCTTVFVEHYPSAAS